VFLVHKDKMKQEKCQWQLQNVAYSSKKTMEYGDRVILVNKHYPDYIMGANPKLEWLEDIKIGYSRDSKHQWIIEKTQF